MLDTTPEHRETPRDPKNEDTLPLSYEEWLKFRVTNEFNYNRWYRYQDES